MTQDIKIRHEGMRIGGETVFTDAVVEVRYPYTDQVIGPHLPALLCKTLGLCPLLLRVLAMGRTSRCKPR